MRRNAAPSGRQGRATATAAMLVVLLAACGGEPPPPPPPPVPVFTAQSGYPRVAAEITDWYLGRHPEVATRIGEHEHDRALASVFPADLQRAAIDARALLTRLGGVNRPTLERRDYFDHRVLEYGVREELLELEQIGRWQRDPGAYAASLSASMNVLQARDVEAEARLQATAARLGQAPLLFRAARQNLDRARVPRVLVENGLVEVDFLRRVLSAWGDASAAAGVPGAAGASAQTRADWEAARRAALASVDSFHTWLSQEIQPSARGDFRLGAATLHDLILYSRHLDIPLARVDSLNRRAIADYRAWMDRVALDFDPLRQPQAIMDSLAAGEPGLVINRVVDARPGVRGPRAVFAPDWMPALEHYRMLVHVESEAVDDATRLRAIRAALHAHALLHAMLQMHAANATIDAAAQDIMSIGMMSFEDAQVEARRLARDPLYALVALDRMYLFALRDRLRAERGGSFDEQAFQAQLVDFSLPLPLAAEAMLGRDPGRLLVVGAPTPGVPEPPRVLD